VSGPDVSPLFEPFTLGGVQLKNRFVLPGMQRAWCRDGVPPPAMAAYYGERAEHGVALLFSESTAVDHHTATLQPLAARMTSATQEGWSACFDAVHRHGSAFFVQLWHEGAIRANDDGHAISPSGLLHPKLANGRAATHEDLAELREAYARSAVLAVEAGADGVEVHCAHGYFLDTWLWAGTNRRDDGYGGDDIADRVRFPAEVVASVRAALGPGVPISLRFSQWKEADYDARVAPTPADLETMLVTLREAGVDVFSASQRWFDRPAYPEHDDRLALSGWVKRYTDAPVITVGSVGMNLDVMDSLVGDGELVQDIRGSLPELLRRFDEEEFDLVAVGRSLLADGGWVRKVQQGRFDDIRKFDKDDMHDVDDWDNGRLMEAHELTGHIAGAGT
jgi:2,4-dienoyl-CoA reductase-like NADH-dependent reductase (Old Yellow Enzyme family)